MPNPLKMTNSVTLAMQSKDRKKAAAWYQDVLGCELLYDAEEIGWCELSTPLEGVNVGFSDVERPKTGAGPVPTFDVADLDKARAQMDSKDVRFDGDTQTIPGLAKLATFFDPDGNALMLSQSLMQS
ncbi:MAG: VOC family protein [Planctomycetota bacterium]